MAFDTYLYFPGSDVVQGETTDKEFAKLKALEISSFSFGASNMATIGSGSGGGGAGKADFSSITVTKVTDKSSIGLFTNLTTGTHFPEMVIALRKSGTAAVAGSVFLQFSFKLVFCTAMSWSGGQGQETLFESVSFDYGSIKLEYFKQDKAGKVTKDGEVMWSRVLGIASDAIE